MTVFRKEFGNRGFTLIELLVVVSIIGILVAIAIPQFSAYKRKAHDAASKEQVKDLATALESYYVDYDAYKTSLAAADLADLVSNNGFQTSSGVTLTGFSSGTSPSWFRVVGYHPEGTQSFTWDSRSGGLQ